MKNMLVLLAWLIFSLPAFAQQKVTRYCVLLIHPKNGFTNTRMTIELQPWRHAELFSFRDTAVLHQLWKVTTMETIPDALNYMSDNGWTFLSTSAYNFLVGMYYFKREFDASELGPPPAQ